MPIPHDAVMGNPAVPDVLQMPAPTRVANAADIGNPRQREHPMPQSFAVHDRRLSDTLFLGGLVAVVACMVWAAFVPIRDQGAPLLLGVAAVVTALSPTMITLVKGVFETISRVIDRNRTISLLREEIEELKVEHEKQLSVQALQLQWFQSEMSRLTRQKVSDPPSPGQKVGG